MGKKINVNVTGMPVGAVARGVSRWSGLGERRHGDGVHEVGVAAAWFTLGGGSGSARAQ